MAIISLYYSCGNSHNLYVCSTNNCRSFRISKQYSDEIQQGVKIISHTDEKITNVENRVWLPQCESELIIRHARRAQVTNHGRPEFTMETTSSFPQHQQLYASLINQKLPSICSLETTVRQTRQSLFFQNKVHQEDYKKFKYHHLRSCYTATVKSVCKIILHMLTHADKWDKQYGFACLCE